MDTIITIGREFGSGGRVIGKLLAERLHIPFYDRDLIALAAERSGLSSQLLEVVDEQPVSVFLQTCSTMAFAGGARLSLPTEISLNDKLFFAQAQVIKNLAAEGPCVIVGRCADYVLRDQGKLVNVFIHADLSYRIERAINVYGIDRHKAKNTVIKTDKRRANYYNYYTNRDWSRAQTYDLCIDSTTLGPEGTAALLQALAEGVDALPAEG